MPSALTLRDSKIQCARFSAFHRRMGNDPSPLLPTEEETGVNKNHVAETYALISLSHSSERS